VPVERAGGERSDVVVVAVEEVGEDPVVHTGTVIRGCEKRRGRGGPSPVGRRRRRSRRRDRSGDETDREDQHADDEHREERDRRDHDRGREHLLVLVDHEVFQVPHIWAVVAAGFERFDRGRARERVADAVADADPGRRRPPADVFLCVRRGGYANTMPREQYQTKLEDLRADVLYMSEVVAERLRKGLDALERQDAELGGEVIDGDAEINDLYLELEGQCTDLIALQQPVAGDLRFIAASFKIITDLERIADLATNLGEYAKQADREVFPDVDVQRIGDDTLAMLQKAMDAYAESDAERCYAVAESDDDLDAACEAASDLVVRDLIERDELREDADVEGTMQNVSRLLLTIRDLERVGDHAVNIAARSLYMIENDDELLY